MRYLAGFVGGVVVAVLLLIFQQHLIAAERITPPEPGPVIMLGSVTKPKPPEYKIYEARQPPEKPEPLDKTHTIEPLTTERVQPPRIPLDNLRDRGIPGDGVYLPPISMNRSVDGGAAAKYTVEPRYPVDALRAGIEGEVELEFTVLPDGSVTDVVVVRAEPRGIFEQQARHAIHRWQFLPKRENGVAVSTRARQVIEFRLPGK